MARLFILTQDGQQSIDLQPNNTLGRHPNNSVQLLDKIVSKEHCIIEVDGDDTILKDLGSLNGTFVNGVRVQGSITLRHGDEIALGTTRARFDDGRGLPNLSGLPLSPPVRAQAASSPTQPRAPALERYPSPKPMAALTTSQPVTTAQPVVQSRSAGGTRVDLLESNRAIGAQVAASAQGFAPFDEVSARPEQLRVDYERLRITWELTRDIGLERDLDRLLEKVLLALFKFVNADRGVILLRQEDGSLQPKAARRRDGTTAPIEVSSTILQHVIKERAGVLTHDATMDFAATKGRSMILNRISSAIVVPLLYEKEVLGALWLDSETLAQFQAKDLEIITAVANQAAMFIENTLLARKIEQEIVARERFSRLLSPNVAEQVLSGKLEVKKGGQRVEKATVFNSDIRGFTAMSETATAEEMVEVLNEYFEQMVETIFRYEGTLDKFMGDGIMAFWGAPLKHDDDVVRSVSCALEQQAVLQKFNELRLLDNRFPLSVGMGIHTGPLVAGYVGSSKALSYTVIGDTANTSARLCGVATSGQVLVSEPVVHELGHRFEVTELAPAQLKGKERPVRIFNVVRERPSAASAAHR